MALKAVLVLTAAFGGGHTAAARNVKQISLFCNIRGWICTGRGFLNQH